MRNLDKGARKKSAEIRLGEHLELRRVLGLSSGSTIQPWPSLPLSKYLSASLSLPRSSHSEPNPTVFPPSGYRLHKFSDLLDEIRRNSSQAARRRGVAKHPETRSKWKLCWWILHPH